MWERILIAEFVFTKLSNFSNIGKPKSCCHLERQEESLDLQYVEVHNHSYLFWHTSGEVVGWQISGQNNRLLISTKLEWPRNAFLKSLEIRFITSQETHSRVRLVSCWSSGEMLPLKLFPCTFLIIHLKTLQYQTSLMHAKDKRLNENAFNQNKLFNSGTFR